MCRPGRAAGGVTAGLIRAECARAEVIVADMADPQACARLVDESVRVLGGLDGLVLNVGFALGQGITGATAAEWDATFAVNTRAHFLVSAAALPVLAPRSAIVYISSAASLRATTGAPSYDSSKAALLGICRQVAREGMANCIRANLVVPSLVDTPLGRDAFPPESGPDGASPAVWPPGDRIGCLCNSVAAVSRGQLR